ncbi:MAG: aldo/keto reductase [Chloroflexota bacterium]|nr:MAG: aldo/keto reductase [Chloroflexota bacterium]
MQYGRIPGVPGEVPRLILGSTPFLGDSYDEAVAVANAYVEAGGTVVETARSYGQGRTEGLIARWLDEGRLRDRVRVFTKGGHHHEEGVHRIAPDQITHDLLESLDELKTDRVALYMLHRDDVSSPVGPIVECLHAHSEAGRIDAYGGSNWSTARLDAANAYAASHGLRPFVVSSVNLALAVPSEPLWFEAISIAGDRAAHAWYRQRQMPLISWSSGARGFFSGRFSPDSPGDPQITGPYTTQENWERLRRVQEFARKRGVTTQQVALAFVLTQRFPTFLLTGPATVQELTDNLNTERVQLTFDEAAWLNLES